MRIVLLVFLMIFVVLPCYGQYKEDENLSKKLQWDDQKLNILIDARFDYQNFIDNGKLDNKTFYGDLLKLWFTGDITPRIHYRVRQRLNTSETLDSRDGLSTATELAWVSFDLAQNWNFKVGK